MSEGDEPFDYRRSDLIEAFRSGTFEAYLRSARLTLTTPVGEELVADALNAHDTGEIDIAAAIAGRPAGRIGIFTKQFLEDALPQLNVSLAEMFAMITSVAETTPGEGMDYVFINGFAEWCRAEAARPALAFQEIVAGRGPAALLMGTLLAGLDTDPKRMLPLTVELAKSGLPDQSSIAHRALGRSQSLSAAGTDIAVKTLKEAIAAVSGGEVEAPFEALLRIAIRPDANASIGRDAMMIAAERNDEHVRRAVANTMMFEIKKVPIALGKSVIGVLSDTTATEPEALDGIDQIIAKNLTGPLADDVKLLLNRVLAGKAATIKKLDSTARALLEGKQDLQSEIIGGWLASQDLTLFSAVEGLCSGFADDPAFSIDFSHRTAAEATRIARWSASKLVAFPRSMSSIFISLLRTGPREAFPEVQSVMFDPLLLTYWGIPRDYFVSALDGASTQMARAINEVLAAHDEYKAAIDAVGSLPELRPSEHHRFLSGMKRHDESRAISKAAREQSIFAQIAPTSLMLYGDSAIFDVFTGPETSERQETPMVSHGFSREIPRLEVLDPFGFWYQRERLLDEEDKE